MATLDGGPIQHGEKCVSIIGGGRRLGSQIARIAVAWRIPRDDMEHVGEGCELMAEALRGRPYSVQQHEDGGRARRRRDIILRPATVRAASAGTDRSEFRQGPVLLGAPSAPWANRHLRRRFGGQRTRKGGCEVPVRSDVGLTALILGDLVARRGPCRKAQGVAAGLAAEEPDGGRPPKKPI